MSREKPVLLLIARNFPPLVGGIEHWMHAVFEVLRDDYDIVLLGPAGCRKHARGAAAVYELPTRVLCYLPVALVVLPWVLLRHRPRHAITSNGLMAPLGVIARWLGKVKHTGFLHGLDVVESNGVYRALFLPFIRRTRHCLVNSAYTAGLCREAGVPDAAIEILHPCIREPLPDTNNAVANELARAPGYLLYAGRVIPRKGLLEFIDHCGQWLRQGEYRLVIAGDAPVGNAGASEHGYMDAVVTAVAEAGLSGQVRFMGALSDEAMAACFRHAALHVLPLVETAGDIEGFGMVVVEAASYGTATVAFDCGGVGDAIADKACLVPAADYGLLMEKIQRNLAEPAESGELELWANGFYPEQFTVKMKAVLSRE